MDIHITRHKMLTFINRTELQGIVHSVNLTKINGTTVAILVVCTEYTYRDAEGLPVIETTWHRVTCLGDKIQGLEEIRKGQAVNVKGRGRDKRYASSDGCDRIIHDTVAESLDIIETGMS